MIRDRDGFIIIEREREITGVNWPYAYHNPKMLDYFVIHKCFCHRKQLLLTMAFYQSQQGHSNNDRFIMTFPPHVGDLRTEAT